MQRNTNTAATHLFATVIVFAFAHAVHAAFSPITVDNPSFEINSGAGDNANPATVADWTPIGWATPVFNPDDLDFADSTDPASSSLPSGPHGTYTPFIFNAAGNNGFEQTLSTSVIADADYRLTFWEGDSGQFTAGQYTAILTTSDGDDIINSLQATPASNGFTQVVLTGTAPSDATGSLVIRMLDVGDDSTNITFFDLFSLEVDAGGAVIPAPAALPAGMALLAMGAMRRRRR